MEKFKCAICDKEFQEQEIILIKEKFVCKECLRALMVDIEKERIEKQNKKCNECEHAAVMNNEGDDIIVCKAHGNLPIKYAQMQCKETNE